MELNKVKVYLNDTMDLYTKEYFKITSLMEAVPLSGQMVKNIQDNGSKIRCKVMDCLYVQMVVSMKAIFIIIKSMDSVALAGQTKENILEIGKMGNRMVLENITQKTVFKSKAYGCKGKEWSGLTNLV